MNSNNYITIKGARSNNLKNISVKIPKNKIVVITGVSGSGKSTLAYDTIYAEAQRRYIESLSSYARQFLKNHNKPEFDEITGLSPAIAIDAKTNTNNPRSTVGTMTEIYHYITLLYEQLGKVISPVSGQEVQTYTFKDVYTHITNLPVNTKIIICCPISSHQLNYLKKEGYSRLKVNNEIVNIDQYKDTNLSLELVVDRLIYSDNKSFEFNLKESYNKAMEIGNDICILYNEELKIIKKFNNDMTLDDIIFEKPNKDLFNFNNPYGACKNCNGHGNLIDIDEEKVIPNKKLSIIENAIAPWKNGKMEKWKNQLIQTAKTIQFPINKKYINLSKEEKNTLWNGKGKFKGINSFFEFLKKKSYKIQYRVMLSRYRGVTKCKICNGSRLNDKSKYIFINSKNIHTIISLPMYDLLNFIHQINTTKKKSKVITRITTEINHRVNTMINLGLDYLTLNRRSNSLSGGEHQRINIAKAIGSILVGSIYILDEPSIGLHSRDTTKLLRILKQLKNAGNSVIMVEHDKDIIQEADYIIDIGPNAGSYGGEIVYAGKMTKESHKSLTLQYINNQKKIVKTTTRRNPKEFILLENINKNNLQNTNIAIPLHVFCGITGVSGSGKSTLLKDILYPAIKRKLKDYSFKAPPCQSIKTTLSNIENIDFIDQNSIKKSSKSTPITYINSYDNIRKLFANQKKSKIYNFTSKDFSFNVTGGRCEECKGNGYIVIEMQFLADITLKCEFCKGKRFQENILNINFCGKNIDNILNLTIQEGVDFFRHHDQESIANQMQPLLNVGLGYVKLGQPIHTFSSGELQRLKLASYLSKKYQKSILIFDEPTKGLHFYDIEILIRAFEELVQNGNTVIVIEHNLDVIKNVDWVIDLGPKGGDKGGRIMFAGNPQKLAKEKSYTGKALNKIMNHS